MAMLVDLPTAFTCQRVRSHWHVVLGKAHPSLFGGDRGGEKTSQALNQPSVCLKSATLGRDSYTYTRKT